ncbi:MAG: SPOR domain-containing protein [Bacteroidaceae bacterium]|nr:SPOR domain-containing protein [Bacteroidaceae bacterium]
MKKFLIFGSALFMVLAMTSCKSKESAYKKAYEKAQSTQVGQQYVTTPTQQTTPVQVTPVNPTQQTTTPVVTQDYSGVGVRSENVTLVSGTGLRAFSVVVNSFQLQSNAQSFQATLAAKGYAAQIVSALVDGKTFYRVVASTHDTKEQAAQSRAALLGTYPDAWLLYKK